MGALATLCSVIAQRGTASKATLQGHNGFDLLLANGFLRDDCVVQSVPCDACDDSHDAQVVFDQGTYGHFCPDAGFVQLSREYITGIRPDFAKLVDALARTLNCKRRKTTPIQGDTWRIGALDTPTGDLVLYFAPALHDESSAREVKTAFAHELSAAFRLILTAIGTLSVGGAKVIQLDDVFELQGDNGALSLLVDLNLIVGAPIEVRNGRPSPYATQLTNLILNRMADKTALAGRNAEAQVIRQLFRENHPKDNPPSLSTVQRKITELRAGSKLDQN